MKCKVIRVSGYDNFSETIEREVNEAIKEMRNITDIRQSLVSELIPMVSGTNQKRHELTALITIFYE